jgi:hypothetical protein
MSATHLLVPNKLSRPSSDGIIPITSLERKLRNSESKDANQSRALFRRLPAHIHFLPSLVISPSSVGIGPPLSVLKAIPRYSEEKPGEKAVAMTELQLALEGQTHLTSSISRLMPE